MKCIFIRRLNGVIGLTKWTLAILALIKSRRFSKWETLVFPNDGTGVTRRWSCVLIIYAVKIMDIVRNKPTRKNKHNKWRSLKLYHSLSQQPSSLHLPVIKCPAIHKLYSPITLQSQRTSPDSSLFCQREREPIPLRRRDWHQWQPVSQQALLRTLLIGGRWTRCWKSHILLLGGRPCYWVGFLDWHALVR